MKFMLYVMKVIRKKRTKKLIGEESSEFKEIKRLVKKLKNLRI